MISVTLVTQEVDIEAIEMTCGLAGLGEMTACVAEGGIDSEAVDMTCEVAGLVEVTACVIDLLSCTITRAVCSNGQWWRLL